MARRTASAEEARDLRGALEGIARVVNEVGTTPRRKLERIVGILGMYELWPIQRPEVKEVE